MPIDNDARIIYIWLAIITIFLVGAFGYSLFAVWKENKKNKKNKP